MPELGQVVFYVRDLQRSLRFYQELLGLELSGMAFGGPVALLTGGRTHHELLPIQGLADHTISRSLYLRDPDGNEVKLYVDDPDYDWRNDRSWLDQPTRPLEL